jgi:hypothetical protein
MKAISLIILSIILVGLLIKIAYRTYFAKQIEEEENEKRRQDIITQSALKSIQSKDVEIYTPPRKGMRR